MERPAPREVWELGHRFVGRQALVYDRLASTSDRAAELSAVPANAGTVILADEQSSGRGQQGRTWQCPPGAGVLLSAVLMPPPELLRPVLLTAWAAVAVGDTIDEALGASSTIKWPNDVLIGGRKVSGILIESRPGAHQPTAVIVGIGLNVNQPAEAFAELPLATSLTLEAGRSFDMPGVARALIRHLDARYARLIEGQGHELEQIWAERVGLVGQEVEAVGPVGVIVGRLLGLGWDGLHLQSADGQHSALRPESVRQLTARSRFSPAGR